MTDALTVILIIIVIVQSIGLLIAYRRGLTDGRALAQDKPLEPIISIDKPVKKQDSATYQTLPQEILDDIAYINGQGTGINGKEKK